MQQFLDGQARAKSAIQSEFDRIFAGLPSEPVHQAMAHAVLNGGKRLRGFLVLEGARLHDIDPARAILPACAIEALHAYSLVHDDLPCMDDDDLRRGQPTVHVKWDEATAVLAGDALQALAFEILAHPETGAPEVRARLVLTLAEAARAMVDGQARDLAAETAPAPLALAEITALQAEKTGALIGWAAQSGARLAGQESAALAAYASAIGLAFQITDDLIDVAGDAEAAGKRLRKDAAAGKATFVSLLGVEAARARAEALAEEACEALAEFGPEADTLRALARYIVERDR